MCALQPAVLALRAALAQAAPAKVAAPALGRKRGLTVQAKPATTTTAMAKARAGVPPHMYWQLPSSGMLLCCSTQLSSSSHLLACVSITC